MFFGRVCVSPDEVRPRDAPHLSKLWLPLSDFLQIWHQQRKSGNCSKISINSTLSLSLSLPFPLLDSLDGNRPVPFRLTPNFQHLFSPIGINGPLYMSMVATSRALVQPQYNIESILLALFRDEFISWHKVCLGVPLKGGASVVVLCVTGPLLGEARGTGRAVCQFSRCEQWCSGHLCIHSSRGLHDKTLQWVQSTQWCKAYKVFSHVDLAEFEKGKSQVSLLIGAASNLDNLCRMDPAWNPWF